MYPVYFVWSVLAPTHLQVGLYGRVSMVMVRAVEGVLPLLLRIGVCSVGELTLCKDPLHTQWALVYQMISSP
jgi:hypothetical protein